MRVAHLVVITPNRCGLYETTRELVAGLQARGVDSRMVDPAPDKNPIGWRGESDRGVPVADMQWALEADIIVSHSGHEATAIDHSSQPIVHVSHGRPRHSFIGEVAGGAPVYSYHYRLNADPRVKSVVTFWPEHRAYHEVMFPSKPVHVIQASVDLEQWSPSGPRGYRFGGHRSEINVVITDVFRDDVDPFVPMNAFALWARRNPGAKLHMYGNDPKMRGMAALIRRMQDDGTFGEVKGWVNGLDNVYRAASFMLTPQNIATRSVREALACGCPVVRIAGVEVEGFDVPFAQACTSDRDDVRRYAEKMFDPRETARQFHEMLARL